MDDNETGGPPARSTSLLPYETWTEDALRTVVARALSSVAKDGLPGEHHFYVSFRTGARGVSIPERLLAQYPDEMTIVLQHQFWDLRVEEDGSGFSVGLSFGGIPATLIVPFSALIGFADPHAQFGLRFQVRDTDDEDVEPAAEAAPDETAAEASEEPQVVSLDAFRKRAPHKES